MMMETVSQQTDSSSQRNEESCSCIGKLWPYLCPPLVAIIFISLALAFAIIYTGVGINKNRHPPKQLLNQAYRHCSSGQIEGRFNIINIQTYPFIGALISYKPYLLLCTVVICSNRFVLTGANCFTTNFPDLRVRVGDDIWRTHKKEYMVEAFVINSGFNSKTLENNVALIKLAKKIDMDQNVKAIRMATRSLFEAQTGITLGWSTWNNEELTSTTNINLVEQELLIWKPARCRRYLGSKISSKFICASLNSTVCNLDVTGPLVVKGKLVGFWSSGLSCLDVPSTFTNLHYFRKWITGVIQH